MVTRYIYTGQYSTIETADIGSVDFGLMFYNPAGMTQYSKL